MTISIFRDPNDTGDIPPIEDTLRIDLERTRNLGPQIAHVMNVSPNLRSADATEIIPLFEDPILVNPARPADLTDVTLTGEILALDDRPYPPVPPPVPPKPQWAQPASHHAVVSRPLAKPKPGRGRHRAATPWWVALVLGLLVVGAAAGALSVLAVIR